MKRKDINHHKSFYFDEYVKNALKDCINRGYSYSHFPENTTYRGYIFYKAQEEIKVPLNEFKEIFKDIPELVMGSVYEDYAKVLPDYIAHDYYNKEFSEKLSNFLSHKFGNLRNCL